MLKFYVLIVIKKNTVVSMKELQKSRKNKNLDLTIFSAIQSGLMPVGICEKYGLNMKTVSYHLGKLKASGSIKRIGYGTWKAIEFREKDVQRIKVGESKPFIIPRNDIRGHAIHFHLCIPKIPNWGKRADFFKDSKTINKKGIRIIIKDHKVHLYDRSIIIYSPKGMSYFADSSEDSEYRAILTAYSIIESLESKMGVSLKVNRRYKLRVFNHEFAHIKDGFAKEFIEKDNKVKVLLQDGWLLIDNSFNFMENESGGRRAIEIMDGWYKPFIKSMDEYFLKNQSPFNPEDVVSLARGLKVVKEKLDRIESDIYKPINNDEADYFG